MPGPGGRQDQHAGVSVERVVDVCTHERPAGSCKHGWEAEPPQVYGLVLVLRAYSRTHGGSAAPCRLPARTSGWLTRLLLRCVC